MERTERGWHGTPEEILPMLDAEIARNKPHALRCLEEAFGFLRAVQAAPEEINPETGERGTDMRPLIIELGAKFGRVFTQEEIDMLATGFLRDVIELGGVSTCVVWNFAHMLEHFTMEIRH